MFSKTAVNKVLAVLLLFSLMATGFGFAEEQKSLFQRLKEKAQTRIEEMKTREYWVVKSGEIAGRLAVGKTVGLGGMGLGAVIGLCLGGPAGAAVGGMLGFRIMDCIAGTFGKALGHQATDNKLAGNPLGLKESWKSLNKGALTAEGIGGAIGNIAGEALGISLGLALLAGSGPIAIPIIGAVSAALIGKKVGAAIGRYLGGKIMRKAAIVSYQALVGESAATDPGKTARTDPYAASLQNRYQAAYRDYVNIQADAQADHSLKKKILEKYLEAKAALQGFLKK